MSGGREGGQRKGMRVVGEGYEVDIRGGFGYNGRVILH